jgi:hypothetical protein
MLVTLKGVRLAFQDIWVPKASQDGKGEPKYGCVLILDPKKNADEVKLIRSTIKAVAKEKWKAKADGILRVLEGDNQKYCYFEEDKLNAEGEIVDGFEGMFYLSCKSPVQPTIIDRDRSELTRKDGRPYNGCFVVAKVDIWPQDNTHGKGLRAQIQGLQFLRDGDAFGGGTRSKVDDFEDLSDVGEEDEEAPRKPAAGKAKAKARPPVEDDDDDIG